MVFLVLAPPASLTLRFDFSHRSLVLLAYTRHRECHKLGQFSCTNAVMVRIVAKNDLEKLRNVLLIAVGKLRERVCKIAERRADVRGVLNCIGHPALLALGMPFRNKN